VSADAEAKHSFTCPCCGAVSYNPNDIAQRFCGRCHDWTGDPELAARHLARHCPHRTEGRAATNIKARHDRSGWFGEPWWSYVCFDEAGNLIEETRIPFPAGESCLLCGEPFDEAAGDSGQATVAVTTEGARIAHVHKECQFRSVVGGLAHHEGRCSCHGGSAETPGMTLWEEAVEVWRRMWAGELLGRNS
jgi:hypothetical protein